MSRPALLIPLVVLSAAALLSAGWWLGRRDASPALLAPRADSAIAAGDAAAAATTQGERLSSAASAALPGSDAIPTPTPTPSATATPPAPLPPAGTRVTDIYDDLLARAKQGDARAACRLAVDLQRCRWAPRAGWLRDRRPDDWETRVAEVQDETRRERMIQMIAEVESQQDEAQRMCEGISRDQIDQAFALQMQAAAAQPELRVHAALSPALDRIFPASELERWQQYRQVAQSWLEQAASEGDLTAIIALARVHGDDRRPGPPVPPYRALDDTQFLTYATLLERYGVQIPPVARAAEEARARLAPDALQRAEARADALYRPGVAFDPAEREAAMRRSFANPNEAPRCD